MADYDQLPGPNYIRLIEIINPSGLLHCDRIRISSHRIDEAPPYTALSYCWGDTAQPYRVQSNIGSLPVSRNLWTMMAQLSLRSTMVAPSFLWIDALSINQRDKSEKTEQVSQMRQIFRMAILVVMWIGEANANTAADFEVLRTFTRAWVSQRAANGTVEGSEDNQNAQLQERSRSGSLADRLWEATDRLLSRPYFRRMWTLQEVLVATNCFVMCGSHTMLYSTFSTAMTGVGLTGYSLYEKFPFQEVESLGLLKMCQDSLCEPGTDLIELLTAFRRLEATDPRDKIYALLGLGVSPDFEGFCIDYSKSVRETYVKFARQMIVEHQNLDILSLVESRDISHFGFPTWVPDFTGDPLHLAFVELFPASPYRAATTTETCQQDNSDPNVVTVKGLIFDNVRDCTDVSLTIRQTFNTVDEFSVNESFIYTLYFDFVAQKFGALYPHTNQAFSDAFLQTISANSYPCGDVEAEDFGRRLTYYNRWIHDERPSTEQRRIFWQSIWDKHHNLGIPELVYREAKSYFNQIMSGRNFFVTEKGYIGIGPLNIRAGDSICLFLGGITPFAVRKVDRETFNLVGECYVHGIMSGEALEGFDDTLCQDFSLV